jgi:hypothetical protein
MFAAAGTHPDTTYRQQRFHFAPTPGTQQCAAHRPAAHDERAPLAPARRRRHQYAPHTHTHKAAPSASLIAINSIVGHSGVISAPSVARAFGARVTLRGAPGGPRRYLWCGVARQPPQPATRGGVAGVAGWAVDCQDVCNLLLRRHNEVWWQVRLDDGEEEDGGEVRGLDVTLYVRETGQQWQAGCSSESGCFGGMPFASWPTASTAHDKLTMDNRRVPGIALNTWPLGEVSPYWMNRKAPIVSSAPCVLLSTS